jgi:hypothetical protein
MLTFNLTTDMKGNALAAPNSFKIKVKAKKGVVLTQNAAFTSKFVGSFAQTLQASGLTGASASVQIPVSVSVGSNSGSIVITQTFTSNGKIAKTK